MDWFFKSWRRFVNSKPVRISFLQWIICCFFQERFHRSAMLFVNRANWLTRYRLTFLWTPKQAILDTLENGRMLSEYRLVWHHFTELRLIVIYLTMTSRLAVQRAEKRADYCQCNPLWLLRGLSVEKLSIFPLHCITVSSQTCLFPKYWIEK